MRTLSYIWGFITFSLFCVAFIMRIVAREFAQFNSIILLTATILLGALLYVKRESVIEGIKTKYFKKMITMIINIFLTTSIVGVVSYLIVKNDKTFDITQTQIHSLSTQSESVLNQLEDPKDLKFTLFSKRTEWNRYLNFLELYKLARPQITIEAIDIEENPSLANLNKITNSGTVLIEYRGKKFQANAGSELDITNSLIKLLRNKSFTLYYMADHGELDLFSLANHGLSTLREKIEASNYELKKANLLNEIPKDASGVLIFNPQTSFLPNEIKNLESYLNRGGALFVSLSPRFDEIQLNGFESFLHKQGINFVNGIVLDRLSAQQGSQASIPVVSTYDLKHPATKDFSGRTVFPISAILKSSNQEDVNVTSLVSSTSFPASWGERNFTEVKSGQSTFDLDEDLKGPIHLLMTTENVKSNARMVVSSSSAFLTNQFSGQTNNFNLFLNSLAWSIKDEQLISLDRPGRNQSVVYLSDMQVSLILYFTVLFLPFSFFIIGIVMFKRRGNR